MSKRAEYESIMGMSRPVSKTHKPMSINDRAAQFSAFAALTGYGDEIKEKGRYTDTKHQITEEQAYVINERLCIITAMQKNRPTVTLTCFEDDALKSGGRYVDRTVTVRRVDTEERLIITDKNEKIPIDSITEIAGEIFKKTGL